VAQARAKKVARAVVVALSRWGRAGTTLKAVAKETGYPIRTVQRAVHRLLEIEEVIEVARGTYCVAATYFDLSSDPGARIGFQNLRFSVRKWREDPMPPCRTARAWRPFADSQGGSGEVLELGWEGRQVKLIWRPSKDHLYVVVAAKEPVPLERAGELKGWLDAQLGLGRGEETEVDYIEVNADTKTFRLERTYLELRDLPGLARVIYQRSEAMRAEARLAKPQGEDGHSLSIQRALEWLLYGSPVSRMERLLDKELELARAAPMRTARGDLPTPAEAHAAGWG
jgi:hypothetical protein